MRGRNNVYGEPEDVFLMISQLWTAYTGTPITSIDVAAMMVLLKVARVSGSCGESEDSWVDIAGYAACGAELAERGEVK